MHDISVQIWISHAIPSKKNFGTWSHLLTHTPIEVEFETWLVCADLNISFNSNNFFKMDPTPTLP